MRAKKIATTNQTTRGETRVPSGKTHRERERTFTRACFFFHGSPLDAIKLYSLYNGVSPSAAGYVHARGRVVLFYGGAAGPSPSFPRPLDGKRPRFYGEPRHLTSLPARRVATRRPGSGAEIPDFNFAPRRGEARRGSEYHFQLARFPLSRWLAAIFAPRSVSQDLLPG